MIGPVNHKEKSYITLYAVVTFLLVIVLREISFESQNLHFSPYFSLSSIHKNPLHSYPTLYDRKQDDEKMNFLIVGDWGMNSKLQRLLAKQLVKHAEKTQSQFVISAGDNFYYYGVLTERDPNILYTFEYSFTDNNKFLQVPWFVSLGNHDSRGSSQAQIDYSLISNRWNMPNNYYYQHFPAVGKLPDIHLVVLDTTPLVCPYVTDIPPEIVMKSMPECELYSYALRARQVVDGWATWEQILNWALENDIARSTQLHWLNTTMEEIKDKKGWKIVIGHHAMESACLVHGSVLNYPPIRQLLTMGNIDLYFAGHDHTLQHIKKDDERFHHIVTGGGGFMTGFSSFHAVEAKYRGLQYGESTFGFISASLSSSSVELQFIDFRGRLLYSTVVTKEDPPSGSPLDGN